MTAPGRWNRAAWLPDVTVNPIANVLWWSGAHLAGAAAGVPPMGVLLIGFTLINVYLAVRVRKTG